MNCSKVMSCGKAGLILIAVLLPASVGLGDVVDFTFAIWSDTHFGYWEGGGFRDNAAEDIINLPGTAYPSEIGGVVGPIEFILHPGDITEESRYHEYEDDDGISDGDFIQCINRWFVPQGIPVYEITGNHDSWNPPGCDQIRAAITTRHGDTSYCFDYHGVHFIGLDGGPDSGDPLDSTALDYLEAHMPTLTTDQAIIIWQHYEPDHDGGAPTLWDRYYDAIEGYNVICICVGHNHYPNVWQWRGFDVFVTSDCKVNHANPGFSVVHVTDTRLTGVAYDWDNDEWYRRDEPPQEHIFIDKEIAGLGPWFSPEVVNPSFEDNGGSLDGWQVIRTDGKGPDNPPLDNTNNYGPRTTFGDYFAGKITCWHGMDFMLGQIIEVADFEPTFTDVGWTLSAYVQLHCHSTETPFPENVHQTWEIGWNDDGSVPATINKCDNYSIIADIDGTDTFNDDVNFYPLSVNGTISGVTGLHYVAFRVRIYNDTAKEWSMSNIDNVSFQATSVPPGPEIELDPQTIQHSIWIGSTLDDDAFTVTNTGTGTLEYSVQIEGDADWLSVWPEAGFSTGGADPIEVRYNDGKVADLDAGQHTATIKVTSVEAWNSPQTVTVVLTVQTVGPDFDGDGDVDLKDFGFLQVCFSGTGIPYPSGCDQADLNNDEHVDGDDLDTFQACLTGANQPANPTCDD